jgi:hypothetical protein
MQAEDRKFEAHTLSYGLGLPWIKFAMKQRNPLIMVGLFLFLPEILPAWVFSGLI